MLTPSPTPLIVTLTLDETSQAFFDEQRRLHFPSKINYLSAHLTLFHALPGAEYEAIAAHLAEVAGAQPEPLPLAVTGLKFMGRGVMYTLANPTLPALHKGLQQHWQAWLSPQDQQGLRPHITVQNKVDPAVARRLLDELTASFRPFEVQGTGLALWAYRGGPWELRQKWAFGGAAAASQAG
ncbi:2'-5' RNA ligase family protein [Hymenobacter sp. HMF4947]|uniref:2'-5' RNA ligase family protein n=1 Tax=Hymenobacter ginkgonis TaxID=2682976 RepID=A0A7K1T9E5_9BACT|nr:2'-5' RNA ligase family protein [Hymenobacter ginkgonis]MVN75034.1 2'-5' RNA ligase family protein [Hymenobacter ginkgonis]